jgi:hypothetical protein
MAGYYSDQTTSQKTCKQCEEGYVCFGDCITPTPENLEEDNGFPCPAGFYCPRGSGEATACPAGTYSNDTEAINSDTCISCGDKDYNNLIGQTSCKSCGSSSYASEDKLTCTCIGKNRAFQMFDSTCLCKPQYKPTDDLADGDSELDCEPVIFPRCPTKQILDAAGYCTDLDDCSKACADSPGQRSTSLGICACQKVDDVDDVCDRTCRSESVTVQVTMSGEIVMTDPAQDQSAIIDVTDIEGFYGTLKCYNTYGLDCKVVNVNVGILEDGAVETTAGFSSNYQANSGMQGAFEEKIGRRILSPIETRDVEENTRRSMITSLEAGIRSPVFCLNLGDSMLFEGVSVDHYPVYLKDSLANSNPDFDYAAFLELEVKLQAGDVVSTFAYSFSQDGIYIFGDSSDYEKQTIIGVMGENKQCSDESKYIVPITYDALLKLGVSQNDDIILSPDWWLIIGLLAAFLIGTPTLIALIYYFSQSSKLSVRTHEPSYRHINRKEKLEKLKAKGTDWNRESLKIQYDEYKKKKNREDDQDECPLLIEEEEEEITRPNKRDKKFIDIRKKENAEGVHEIEPEIFQDIYNELQDHTRFIKNQFAHQAQIDQNNLQSVFESLDGLKKLMQQKLTNIAGSYGRNIRLIFGHRGPVRDADDALLQDTEKPRSRASSASSIELQHNIIEEVDEELERDSIDQTLQGESLSDLIQNGREDDDECFNRAIEKIDKEKSDFLKEFSEEENDKMKKFKDELDKDKTLSPEEKKRMLEEYEEQMEHINKMLVLEEERQDNSLKKKLEERRKRRELLENKVRELQLVQLEEKGKLGEEIKVLHAQKKEDENKLDKEIQSEMTKEKDILNQEKEDHLQKVKEKFQKKLAKTSDSETVKHMLGKYEKEMGILEKTLENERGKQEEDLLMKLEMKRMERRKKIREKYKEEEDKLVKERKGIQNEEIQKQIEVLTQNMHDNEVADEINLKLAENDTTDEINETELGKINTNFKNINKQINKEERKELQKVKKELIEADKQEKGELKAEKQEVLIYFVSL